MLEIVTTIYASFLFLVKHILLRILNTDPPQLSIPSCEGSLKLFWMQNRCFPLFVFLALLSCWIVIFWLPFCQP